MKIKADWLSETPLVISASEAIADYQALAEIQDAGEYKFLEPLHLDVTFKKEFDHIRVQARVATSIRLACSRCLTEYDADLVSVFTVFFTKASKMTLDEEIALSEEDLISSTYDGEYIDLTSEIQEQVIMEIPVKPLCNEDCLGLCANCGADLNAGDCGCEHNRTGIAFSALKNFTVKK
jgi:uncharacterized protein